MGEKMHFSELDQYLFGQGTHYDIYKKSWCASHNAGKKKMEFILRCGRQMLSLFL